MNQYSCQHTLTVQQCRILLTDIACCSLMRLDMTSMDKLWDLMVMLFKWQLTMIRDTPSRLLELTFRHMDGVAKLMPEMKKTLLVDSTRRCLVDFWEDCSYEQEILNDLLEWMVPFNIKISILIRSGLQLNDGTFEMATEQTDAEYFRDYLDNIGENIYARNANTAKSKAKPVIKQPEVEHDTAISNELSTLASQLNIDNDIVDVESDRSEPDGATHSVEAEIKQSASARTDDKNDVDGVNCTVSTEHVTEETDANGSEFIYLKKATSALQGYLEQFEMENMNSNTGMEDRSDGDGVSNTKNSKKTFDATEELLKLLEDKDNEGK